MIGPSECNLGYICCQRVSSLTRVSYGWPQSPSKISLISWVMIDGGLDIGLCWRRSSNIPRLAPRNDRETSVVNSKNTGEESLHRCFCYSSKKTRQPAHLGVGGYFAFEGGHDLFSEPLQLLGDHALGSSHGMAHANPFQGGIVLLHRLELLDDTFGRSG